MALKFTLNVVKMANWSWQDGPVVKAPAVNINDPSLIPGTHVAEGTINSHKLSFSLHAHAVTKPFVDSHSICNQRENKTKQKYLASSL